jgi:hypothetical protein
VQDGNASGWDFGENREPDLPLCPSHSLDVANGLADGPDFQRVIGARFQQRQ